MTTEALINAIEYENHDLIEILIQKNTCIDYCMITTILPIYTLTRSQEFYVSGLKQREETNKENDEYYPLLSKDIFDVP